MSIVVFAMVVASAAGQGSMETSFSGNKCIDDCRASASDGFKCDSCSTGFLRVDRCVYPGNASFRAQDFKSKLSYFWNKLTEDLQPTSQYPDFAGLFSQSVHTVFNNMGDEMPSGRVKVPHAIGVVCPFKIDNAAESPYTGLFEPGEREGFVRLAAAINFTSGPSSLSPGVGIKFPRTGRPSGNYVALSGFVKGWNFFAANLSNHIAPLPAEFAAVAMKQREATNCGPQVGLSDMAKYSQDGTKLHSPKFPFKLFLVPSAQVQTPDTKKTVDELNAEMIAFPVGTSLYTVYACGKALGDEMRPTEGSVETTCGDFLKLGSMVTTAACTTSAYGDKSFHIRHQAVEEDWQADPSILHQEGYNASKACGWLQNKVDISIAPTRCDKSGMLSDDVGTTIQRAHTTVTTTTISPGKCAGNDSRCNGSTQSRCKTFEDEGADCRWHIDMHELGACKGNDSRCEGSSHATCVQLSVQGSDCQWEDLSSSVPVP